MTVTIEQINGAGQTFVEFALPMLIQSGLLILILLSVDLLLRKKVRAVFRYWLWMLVLVKLLLPTSLSSPVSVGRWFGDELAYVDVTPAPAAEPKADIAPMAAIEARRAVDIRRIETAAPEVAAVEPTARPLEPTAAEPISPPSSPATLARPLSWQGAGLLSWLAVVAAMALLLLQRALFVRRLVAQAGEADHPMTEVLANCRRRMAVKRKIDLRISASATSPAVCGLFNPVILVPENLAPGLSSGELRVVLLHELAHIKRGDLWVNLAQTILQIFYFYNPLLWLANAVIRRAREQAVDEMVLVAMGDNARQYPQTLVSVAKMAFNRPALSLRLTGVVESKSALTGRIKHILNRPMPKTAKLGILSLLVVLVAAAILLPMAAFMPGPPELVVKGTVKDAQTGRPIAGARVFDDRYGPMPSWGQIRADERSEWGAITNATGEYSFLTWSEHHSISAEAPGYVSRRESLYDNHFTINTNDEETMDFVLESETVNGPAKEGIGTDSPHSGIASPSVPVIAYEVKLNFADPTVTDGSFHSCQSVSFSMSFDSFDSLKTDTLFGRLLIGQTTLPVLLKGDLITIQDGSVGKTIRSETWPADEPQFEKIITLPLKYGQKEYSCPVRVELMRQQGGNPIGSYWFCAYLSGRLPWGAGGRGFEIVNLDQQMEFRPVGDGTDKRDAVLGIDINGDGKIDPTETGSEQFDLYEPFQIGTNIYRVTEVDPYMPRVVFREVESGKADFVTAQINAAMQVGRETSWGEAVDGISVRLGGSEPLGLFYTNNELWLELKNRSNETIEFSQEPCAQKGTQEALWGYLEISDMNGQAVEYMWRAGKNTWNLRPGKNSKNSFVNGRPLRKSGPGIYRARVTLAVHSLESGKTFEVKSNWYPFEVTPCGYPPDFVPKMAYEQLRQADAYHALTGFGHATAEEVIRQYEAIIEEYPNSKYELESHFGIAQAASENRDPSSVNADDYALSRRHYQAIIRQWPDVVTHHTIHARYQAYFQTPEFIQSRRDLYEWLKSLTTEQKINSMRNYFIWPFEPSDEEVHRAVDSLDKVIVRHISRLEETDVQVDVGDDDEILGRVVDENGEPVPDAQVALCTENIGVMVSNGKLKPIRKDVESRIVRTDSEGVLDLGQQPAESFDLIVAHDKGFAIVGYEDYLDSHEIQLQPWGRIEGRVAQGRYASENNIWMAGLPNPTWLLHKLEHRYETECDANGSFTFEKVPAGWFESGYLIRTGDSGWSITSRTPVEVKSGETAEITLGGSGLPVVGKFVPPASYDKSIYFGNGLRALDRTRPDEPRPDDYDRMTKREQQQWRTQWRKTDQYRQYSDAYWHDPNWRQYTFRINDDGSFRIEDVIAGEYNLTVWIEERLTGGGRPEEIAGYYGSIEVPEITGGRSDEPLDLGDLELTMNAPLAVGDVAPLFEARTFDGKDLKRIDYRGKFVLLSFWQPVSHPELERLKILSAGYNAAGRLEIIGLGGNDTLEEVKRYVEENDIPWPQIFIGEELRSGIAKDYRIPGVPWIFLIGPDGRVVANGLRGEKLSSTVLEALESTERYKTKAPPPFSRARVTDVKLPFKFKEQEDKRQEKTKE